MALDAPPQTRSLEGTAAAHVLDPVAVARWLLEHVDGCPAGEAVIRQFKGGQSNPTYWVHLEGVMGGLPGERALVLRKKPPGDLLPSAHAVEREFRILRALHGTDVPVPRPLSLCEDPGVIGTPFFVMDYVEGQIFWDPTLPEVTSDARRGAVYLAYIEALAALHRVDFAAAGLSDYGKVGGYVARQVERWSRQYEASRTSTVLPMEALLAFVRGRAPASDETTLIHGDYRLDNLVFARSGAPRVLAVLDWELSTLGHPVSDLAYACMSYQVNLPGRGGLVGLDLAALGIPTEQALVDAYCARTGRARIDDWAYFMAFGIFRLAAIAQGVYKRSLQGNASSDNASSFGEAVTTLAELGCSIAGVRPR
jgi:aminoglycoside phosphotransferase (APT) family kinase protein